MKFKDPPAKIQRSKTNMGEDGGGGDGTKFDLSFDLHGIRELQISC